VAGGVSGGGGAIATSPDGITWQAQTSPFTINCYAVAANGNMFVAAGNTADSNNIAYSYNGITWVKPNTASLFGVGISSNARSVAWNGRLWVVGGTAISGSYIILTSSDGITWEKLNITSGFNKSIRSVAWNGSLWIAVGFDDEPQAQQPEGFVIRSSDGETWIDITINLGSTNPFSELNTVSWNGARWFIGGSSATTPTPAFTTVDTITWTPVTTGLESETYGSASRRVLPYVGLTVDGSAGSTGPTGPAGGGGEGSTGPTGPAGGGSISIVSTGTIALTVNNVGTIYFLITSLTPRNFTTNTLPSGNVSLIWFVKNCNPDDIEIKENGDPILGATSTLFALTTTNNSSLQYLYWNGSVLVML